MKIGFRGIAAGLLVLCAQETFADVLRPWTVRDSTAVRYFVGYRAPGNVAEVIRDNSQDSVVSSPDGKYFFFVSRHGELQTDSNLFQLQIFEAADVLASLAAGGSMPRPFRTVELRSFSSRVSSTINRPRWTDGSAAIVFSGFNGNGPSRLYRLDLGSAECTPLSGDGHEVLADYAFRDGSLIYPARILEPRATIVYPSTVLSPENLAASLGAIQKEKPLYEILASYRGGEERALATTEIDSFGGQWLSADGRYAIVLMAPRESAFSRVSFPKAYPRYFAVDMMRAQLEPLFDAPAGMVLDIPEARKLHPDVFWANDSLHAVIVNTALPPANGTRHDSMSYVIAYEARTARWNVLEPLVDRGGRGIHEVRWLGRQSELLITHVAPDGSPAGAILYSLKQDRWVGREAPATVETPKLTETPLPAGLSAAQYESANDPPVIMAETNGHELALTGPDPALMGIWRAQAQTVEWRESNGTVAKGLLMLPRRLAARRPMPLVIHAYQYWPHLFRPDGPYPSGYAAQPIVARGMAVLQLKIVDFPQDLIQRTAGDVAFFVERIDAAVESLSRQGLIDRTRVGLIGFSRGGDLTCSAITHPGKTKLAAAYAVEGGSGGYVMDLQQGVQDFHTGLGLRGHFWDDKATALELWNGFNANRVETPFLQAPANPLTALELFAAFRINRRPAEFMIFPDAQHNFVRPRERFESLTAGMDWMAFWLQGREDIDPVKTGKYARWRALRQERDAPILPGR